jgi:hypothetical protein
MRSDMMKAGLRQPSTEGPGPHEKRIDGSPPVKRRARKLARKTLYLWGFL